MNDPRDEHGQVLILVVLAIVALLGFTALAIDGGMAYSDRRQSQNAADAAALAGALAKLNNGDWHHIALERANSNGYSDGVNGVTVRVYNPPISGPYTGNSYYVQVIVTSQVNTAFAHFIYNGQIKNTVQAVARYIPGEWGPLFPGQAIVGMKPNGNSVVWGHGSGSHSSLHIEGGGIFSNSSDSCGFKQDGSKEIHVTGGTISVVGGACYDPADVTATGGILTEQPAHTYPPTEYITPPTCSSAAVKTGNTLSAGSYSGAFPPSGVTVLQAGIYCVDGNFTINASATLTGTNVLIYMTGGDITWNGGSNVHLSAPTAPPYQGLLVFHDLNGHTGGNHGNCDITVNGNNNTFYTGTIYAPSCDIKFTGTGNADGWHSQIIGYTVEVGGTNDMYDYYDDADNYTGTTPPKIELAQ